jgi:nifR3 family TIM-barrel protein
MSQLTKLPKPFLVLAPMYDVTDTVFRQVIASTAPPDLFFTEFVNVDGLQSEGRKEVVKRLKHSKKEKPIIAQIWGLKPENYYKTAKELVEMGFDGIDINMGCPDKAVIKNGCCIGLMNNRDLAVEIIQATKKGAGDLPVSVKTRTGFNSIDLSWHELLLQQDIAMLSIHGRTKSEMSKVPANWEVIGQIRELRDKIAPDTLIVGNGDVMNKAEALELSKKYQLNGIMIGRGVFSDPFVFADNSPWEAYPTKKRVELFKKHIELFKETYGDTKPTKILNKFCKIYIHNFNGAKEQREKLMAASSTEELLAKLDSIKPSID